MTINRMELIINNIIVMETKMKKQIFRDQKSKILESKNFSRQSNILKKQ